MKKSDTIMGLHSVEEVLKFSPKRFIKVFMICSKSLEGRKKKLLKQLEENKIKIQFVDKKALSTLVNSDSHQGCIGFLHPRKYYDLALSILQTSKKEKALFVVLDRIYDPQNFGAILRASECFGVYGIIWSKNRGSHISPTVCKASSGASELIRLIPVSNLANSISLLQKGGFSIIAADSNALSLDLKNFTFPKKSVLILGSEGDGIQSLLLKKCDHHIKISMQGNISSLNVSQAASVLLSRF